MNINASLGDDEFHLIFARLPLEDYFTAAQVCTRWLKLVPVSGSSVHSLTVLIDDSMEDINSMFVPWSNEIYLNKTESINSSNKLSSSKSIKCPILTIKRAFMLANTFRHVTSLDIIHYPDEYDIEMFSIKTEPLEQIGCLLRLLASTVVTLRIRLIVKPELFDDVLSFDKDEKEERMGYPILLDYNISELFDALTSMRVLKHLTLDMGAKLFGLDMPFLSQLESFYFFTNDHLERRNPNNYYSLHPVIRLLVDYARSNDALRRIGLGFHTDYFKFLEFRHGLKGADIIDNELDLEQIPADLRCRFVHLLEYEDGQNDNHTSPMILEENAKKFCQQFCSLTSIWLRARSNDFTITLQPLINLINLKVTLDLSTLKQTINRKPALPNLKLLHLCVLGLDCHTQLSKLLPFDLTFPNLLQFDLTLYEMHCITCGYEYENDSDTQPNNRQLRSCAKKIVEFVRHCPLLRHANVHFLMCRQSWENQSFKFTSRELSRMTKSFSSSKKRKIESV